MFNRRSSASREDNVPVAEAQPVAEERGQADSKGRTPGKGRPTPKRSVAQARKLSEPPPANRREAARRARELRMADRAERRMGMERGDDRYLMPRDRGPERRLVRDIVDSRRTVGTWFFGAALLIVVGTMPAMPIIVQMVSQLLWIAIAVLFAIDAVLVSRRVNKLIRERFPKTTQRKPGLFLYAIMRSITFRRLRIPKPMVQIGDKI